MAMKNVRSAVREMWTCHALGQWLQHYLDDELDAPLATQVAKHLETCVRCGLEFEAYVRIQSALRDATAHSPTLRPDDVAVQRLRQFATELVRDDGRNG